MRGFLLSESERDLSDAGKQVALLAEPGFVALHGSILKSMGGEDEGERIRRLYDAVTARCVRMAGLRDAGREEAYREIRETIRREAAAAGAGPLPPAARDNAKGG